MVGVKLEWTGAGIAFLGGHWIPQAFIVGGIIFLIGNILMWLDK